MKRTSACRSLLLQKRRTCFDRVCFHWSLHEPVGSSTGSSTLAIFATPRCKQKKPARWTTPRCPPRRLTRQRASRHRRAALYLVVRRNQLRLLWDFPVGSHSSPSAESYGTPSINSKEILL